MKNQHKLITTLLLGLSFCLSCAHESPSTTSASQTQILISLDKSEFKKVKFFSRHFGENDWQGTLAMNIAYEPIKDLRRQMESTLYRGNSLKFLTTWEARGEAHVTTITPVEYQECMWSEKRKIYTIHIKEIEKIALKYNIQSSDLKIKGVGFGRKKFDDRHRTDETHFIIVNSDNLEKIRDEIYKLYQERKGKKDCWHPNKFYPHITIGYTHKDLHFPDVEKNIEKSLDPRFKLDFTD